MIEFIGRAQNRYIYRDRLTETGAGGRGNGVWLINGAGFPFGVLNMLWN